MVYVYIINFANLKVWYVCVGERHRTVIPVSRICSFTEFTVFMTMQVPC